MPHDLWSLTNHFTFVLVQYFSEKVNTLTNNATNILPQNWSIAKVCKATVVLYRSSSYWFMRYLAQYFLLFRDIFEKHLGIFCHFIYFLFIYSEKTEFSIIFFFFPFSSLLGYISLHFRTLCGTYFITTTKNDNNVP